MTRNYGSRRRRRSHEWNPVARRVRLREAEEWGQADGGDDGRQILNGAHDNCELHTIEAQPAGLSAVGVRDLSDAECNEAIDRDGGSAPFAPVLSVEEEAVHILTPCEEAPELAMCPVNVELDGELRMRYRVRRRTFLIPHTSVDALA